MDRRDDCSNHDLRSTREGSDLCLVTENLHSDGQVMVEKKVQLAQDRSSLDPAALLRGIREAQAALVAVSSPDHGEPAWRESLEQYLSLPPTHGKKVKNVLPTLPGPEGHGIGERASIPSMANDRISRVGWKRNQISPLG